MDKPLPVCLTEWSIVFLVRFVLHWKHFVWEICDLPATMIDDLALPYGTPNVTKIWARRYRLYPVILRWSVLQHRQVILGNLRQLAVLWWLCNTAGFILRRMCMRTLREWKVQWWCMPFYWNSGLACTLRRKAWKWGQIQVSKSVEYCRLILSLQY